MKYLGTKKVYENINEIINPEHTAIVLWDLQNGLVENVFNKDELIGNIKSLIAEARKKNIKLIYTKITPLPFEYMPAPGIYSYMKRFHIDDPSKLPVFMKPGSREAEIYSDFEPSDRDFVLNKNTASIFIGTNIDNMLKAAKIETLIFTGIATEIGVESSVRDSLNLGYYTVVASDSCSSANREGHEAALKSMGSVAIIETTKNIISTLEKL
ncbi:MULTISPECIES: isochorismatase family cysteine hydrolase [Acidiplasma]|jgi:nicotinamidase-related amidase|uniref:Isochorismatase n=2 Tax=Acidiplasma TaxID=507753 RepID=A0A0Q0RY65_9ARCH|nr:MULTISPECIES: isochorismatase family cysteine hydrolase [Acidiplasma]KJE49699.1 isochorismatase [Acidiplasma sp. MBA-1]KPV46448.1 isochorismatase [Acidiplasma aeolicum]KQB34164.1 isochorismatase [Acidiplasma aeolicum]KQB35024.1 isochorismatase [Acidiplasma cupricumulans]WMT55639.1 MAG: isochorismatase family cysteine hydrolase [Acidiplasma sp.]